MCGQISLLWKSNQAIIPKLYLPNTHWLVILFLLSKLINSEQLACYASAITPFPSHPLTRSLSLSGSLSHPALHHAHSLPALTTSPHTHTPLPLLSPTDAPYLAAPARWCFGDDIHYRSPHDLWHCLVGQLLFPSLINFDVEPNEIRRLIKAAADSGLIYSCVWHPSRVTKKKTNEEEFVCASAGLREVRNCSSAVHQLPPEMASAASACDVETLHITVPWITVEQETPSSSLSLAPSLSPPLSSIFLLTAPFPFSRL